jgi:addiction module RelE/StbE family toxin
MTLKYKIVYLELAREDVKEIRSYLAQFYPGTPAKFLSALKEQIGNLTENPYMYEAYDKMSSDNTSSDKTPSFRRMVVSNYLVFYKVDDEKRTIAIHRILHGSRDISKYISL